MSAVAYAAGVAVVACLIFGTVALCLAAGRADALAAVPEDVDERLTRAITEAGLVDDHTAFDARTALPDRRADRFTVAGRHHAPTH